MKWNTNEFVNKAIELHGNKYDYSKSVCNKSTDKVVIICPKHGEFEQQARCHLRGQNCPKCSLEQKNNKKSTKEYFLKRVYGKYHQFLDYSLVDYKNGSTPICIICHKKDVNGNEHGKYWITPHNHINNCGCPKCKSETISKHSHSKSNTEQFIEKSRVVHGLKYDYSKVEYVNSRTKVCIICTEHGEFWQTPSSHLKGEGCNRCSKKVYNTETFIEKAKHLHGDRYDYSKVEYINNHTKVCIICPEHGEFYIIPSNFNNISHGVRECPKCQINKKKKVQTSNREDFILKARQIHGWKYDYSKVEYVNSSTKVCIICPEHGEFWMSPNKHLMGESCPKCQISRLERDVMQLLEKNNIQYIKEYSPSWAHRKRYDFCIENKKLIIECQGEQHYTPVDFANRGDDWAQKLFNKNQERDKLKKQYAEENGYKVIYYTDLSYNKFNEIKNLNDLLTEIIKSNDKGGNIKSSKGKQPGC